MDLKWVSVICVISCSLLLEKWLMTRFFVSMLRFWNELVCVLSLKMLEVVDFVVYCVVVSFFVLLLVMDLLKLKVMVCMLLFIGWKTGLIVWTFEASFLLVSKMSVFWVIMVLLLAMLLFRFFLFMITKYFYWLDVVFWK